MTTERGEAPIGHELVRADTRRTPTGIEIEMVLVPAGPFVMGSETGAPDEKPAHVHSIPEDFSIARRPVTQAVFRSFLRDTGRPGRRWSWPWADDLGPAVDVTWFEAVAFCEWAGLELPTEAAWEKAARGTDDRPRKGAPDTALGPTSRALILGMTPGPGAPSLWMSAELLEEGPVASPYGALDMEDGVLEWCSDRYSDRAYLHYALGELDPPSDGPSRVARGSLGGGKERAIPPTRRWFFPPEHRDAELGFRPTWRCAKGHDRPGAPRKPRGARA